jgi:hypothetical protein
MNRTTSPRTSSRLSVAQIAVGIMGVIYVLTGLALLFLPQWFFQNIGPFPPYNRHYESDAGSFILALGIGLVIAARDPARYRLLIAVVALGSLIHVFNHLYDDVQSGETLLHQITDLAPLVLFVLLLALGLGGLDKKSGGQR